jgi:hypothetical protein
MRVSQPVRWATAGGGWSSRFAAAWPHEQKASAIAAIRLGDQRKSRRNRFAGRVDLVLSQAWKASLVIKPG